MKSSDLDLSIFLRHLAAQALMRLHRNGTHVQGIQQRYGYPGRSFAVGEPRGAQPPEVRRRYASDLQNVLSQPPRKEEEAPGDICKISRYEAEIRVDGMGGYPYDYRGYHGLGTKRCRAITHQSSILVRWRPHSSVIPSIVIISGPLRIRSREVARGRRSSTASERKQPLKRPKFLF